MSDVTLEAPELREYLLALADDDHLMGQQHTEWIGVAPFLEEDMAFASIGQDELGHAAALYALLAGDGDQDLDSLAIGRAADGYRSCHLVEYDTAGWDEALIRHWMHDTAEELRWQALADSSVPEVAGLVGASYGADPRRRCGDPCDAAVVRHQGEGIVDAEKDLQVHAGHHAVAEHGHRGAPVGGYKVVEGGDDPVPEGLVAVGEHVHRILEELADHLVVGVQFLGRGVGAAPVVGLHQIVPGRRF